MTKLTPDPFAPGGIARFGERLRKGKITAEAATAAYLERIAVLDPKLQAYEHVAADQALATARAMDALLAAGTDLGPLMGLPVAIKDLIAVEGMPTTAGSNIDVSDLIGPEGTFIKTLKRCGCVILGKATTVEFAFGTLGINRRRTPWNPWDAEVHRVPGGSSSGPGVATAAGLCAFAIGSDTGGSVRLPAGFCGTFGLKTTVDLIPTDGVFPLCAALDSIGPLTRSAEDAAIVLGALTGQETPEPVALGELRLARPTNYFYDNLDEHVVTCMDAAVAALEKAGVEIVAVEIPEAGEREKFFPMALPASAIAVLGRERFHAEKDNLDPIVAMRCANGLEVKAAEYIQAETRRKELCEIAAQRMEGFDGWITPTIAMVAPPVSNFEDLSEGMRLTMMITQDTQPGNLFGQCGTTTPIQSLGSALPVGLQIMCAANQDARALSIARAIEDLIGAPVLPDMEKFV
jgi:aspartyl-tRNA(Asn)/glutamyl-tRNA(Gln) amidotransferase subunit A